MQDIPLVQELHLQYLEKKAGGDTFQNNLRASSLGWACERYHYYALTQPHKAPSPFLQAIFDEGGLHEKDIEEKLRILGFDVEAKQQMFRCENPLVSGKIDGKMSWKGGPFYPYDAKSASTWTWQEVNTPEDLMYSKKPWERLYPVQILCYLYMTNAPYGFLVMKDKQTGMIKDIRFSFDEHVGWLDSAFARAKKVYENVEAKTAGQRSSDLELCAKCPWKDVCLPDILTKEGVNFIESLELQELLEGRERLKDGYKEYNQLDRRVKDVLKPLPVGEKVCGDFLIQIKEHSRDGYTVEATTYRVVKTARIKEEKPKKKGKKK